MWVDHLSGGERVIPPLHEEYCMRNEGNGCEVLADLAGFRLQAEAWSAPLPAVRIPRRRRVRRHVAWNRRNLALFQWLRSLEGKQRKVVTPRGFEPLSPG